MYAVLWWKDDDGLADSYLTFIKNENGSIRLFETLDEADEFVNKHELTDDLRVISIEGVRYY